jgi:zeaxanthin glucosyltransferase
MAHFGVLSYKGSGHLNPLMALSAELIRRGHRVTFFQNAELEQRCCQQGIEFWPIDTPAPTRTRELKEGANDATSMELRQIRASVDRVCEEMSLFLREYHSAIRAARVDVLLMGEISLTGPTVAEMLKLPYFIISTSIPHNFGWDPPGPTEPRSWLQHLRRNVLEVSILRMQGPICHWLDRYRKKNGLGSVQRIESTHPELAHITQWPKVLDRVRASLPRNFYYAGPFVDPSLRPAVAFPWERLDGRPIVYASLGTTRRSGAALVSRIIAGCSTLDMQLVFSLGGRREPAAFQARYGNAVIVGEAPQLELIERSEIVVTHAGPNTVLETLLCGKPMVALPLVLDQPAVASRLATEGAAEVLASPARSEAAIRSALLRVSDDPSYRANAERLKSYLASSSGVKCAADIIEDRLHQG